MGARTVGARGQPPGPRAECQRGCLRYLLVVYKHGRHETAGRPLDQACRLLRSHVDQHAFSHQERRQPGGDGRGTETLSRDRSRCGTGGRSPGRAQGKHTGRQRLGAP